MIRVLVVDDHEFFRSCVVSLINASTDLEVVGECADGGEVAAAVAAVEPDIVLMDVRMGTMSGIDATRVLGGQNTTTRVLMLTSDTSEGARAAARASGAAGYLIKGNNSDLILHAIRQVAEGSGAWPEDLDVSA